METIKPKLPFFDITRQFRDIKPQVMQAFEKILDNQACVGGSAVADFEKAAAEWMGVQSAVTCANGTDALILALKALGVGPGDEVITPSYSFFCSSSSIAWVGAKPVWADILPDTYCIDPKEVKKKITSKTKAIMVVHLYGQCADMDEILEIAREHKLAVLEDTAQAIGAKYKGRPAGGIGDIGTISFYPTKNLGAAGDAGMITSNNEDLGRKSMLLRQHGMPKRYTYDLLGVNSRLDALQCAYLHVKLPYLNKWNQRRNEIASYYIQKLKPLEAKGLILPVTRQGNYHVWHQFMVRVPHRDQVRDKLAALGIPTDVYYPKPIPSEAVLSQYVNKGDAWPVAEECAKTIMALPVFPELTQAELDLVVNGLFQVL